MTKAKLIEILELAKDQNGNVPMRLVRKAFEKMKPERKRGKWIKNETESAKHVEAIYICSCCHNFEAWGETEKYNFCPHCGADMRGGDDG